MEETPGKMYALAAVLTTLAIVAVLLRFYARHIKKVHLAWDDYMILPALLFTIGTGLCMFTGTAFGDLGRHTPIGPNGMPKFDHRTQVFEQITYASQLTQTLTFGFTKLAVLLFYKRIFFESKSTAVVLAMIGIVAVWTVGFFFANMFQCIPISVNWTGFGGTPQQCVDTNQLFLAQAWSDVFTDVMILSLPVPCIWALQMPALRKVAILCMFFLGTLVVAAGVAKLVVFLWVVKETQSGAVDVTYIMTPTLYWPMVESSLGIVGACLPLMRPIFTKHSPESIFQTLRTLVSRPSSRSGSSSKRSDRTLVEDQFTYKSPVVGFTPKNSHEDVHSVHEQNVFDNYFETEDRLPPMPKVEKVSKFAEKGIGETYEADNNV
ncbi:hypothetical protein MMC28_001630 [Mycoblastus sanguinarius]|nr:hypothetical protein [Mycoblastus sanguinarius]